MGAVYDWAEDICRSINNWGANTFSGKSQTSTTVQSAANLKASSSGQTGLECPDGVAMQVVRVARTFVGNKTFNGYCQKFASTVVQKVVGGSREQIGSAREAGNKNIISSGTADIPVGAAVYFYSPYKSKTGAGHVGIYTERGMVIAPETPGGVQEKDLSYYLNSSYYEYRGWGWVGGVALDGSWIPDSNEDLGNGSYSDGDSDGGSTEPKYIHEPETDQYFTLYPDDNKNKAVDRYKVAFKKWDGSTYDISDICCGLQYKDSASDVATQITCEIVANKYDKYMKNLKPQTGDTISVTNLSTNITIFKGMIIQITRSGLTGVAEITAMDGGRILTQNNIVTQFQHQPCYEVISTCANKAGVKNISSPKFKSTYTGVYSGQASQLIDNALTQISQENGVKYFTRVINDTIVIKSYSNNVITPYWRAADNVGPAPCFANASEYNYTEDSTEIATKILVSQNQQGVDIVVAEAENSQSVNRWGKTSVIVQANDSETVSPEDKAIYNLYYGDSSKPKTQYTLSAPGSDAVTAGSLIKVYIDGEPLKLWVDEVTHSYYPNHTMKLQLTEYSEPLSIDKLRAIYGEAQEQDAQTEADAQEEDTEEEEDI